MQQNSGMVNNHWLFCVIVVIYCKTHISYYPACLIQMAPNQKPWIVLLSCSSCKEIIMMMVRVVIVVVIPCPDVYNLSVYDDQDDNFLAM